MRSVAAVKLDGAILCYSAVLEDRNHPGWAVQVDAFQAVRVKYSLDPGVRW